VVGQREEDDRKVALRRFGSKGQNIMTLDEALEALPAEALAPDLRSS